MTRPRARVLPVLVLAACVLLASAGTAEARWGRRSTSNANFLFEHPLMSLTFIALAVMFGGNGHRNSSTTWRGCGRHDHRW